MGELIRKVVCAACKDPKSGVIYCGPRHFDSTMWAQIHAAGIRFATEFSQGFIDQRGVFMDRREALHVALAAGQTVHYDRQGGIKHELYSEGLY